MKRRLVSDHRPLAEKKPARTFPLRSSLFNPTFQTSAGNLVNAALGYYLEHRGGRGDRHSASGMPVDVSQVEMRGIVGAVRIHIEAVAPALAVNDGNRAPFSH